MKKSLRHEAEFVFTKINIMSYHDMKKTWPPLDKNIKIPHIFITEKNKEYALN